MAATIQFESHRVELPVVYELEHDPSVLEYYDQPPSIPLFYESGNGRRLSVIHTPDFFVLRTDAAGWEECKAEQDLEKLAEKGPNRYRRDSNGGWLCPPGESHAKEFGLYYRVLSSATINWIFQQNLQFLEDYFRCDGMVISPRSREAVAAEIARKPGLPLMDLIQRTKDAASRDDIYFMIAGGEIFADLSDAAISQPAEVAIFSNAELAAAFRRINGSPNATATALEIKVEPGQSVSWDGMASGAPSTSSRPSTTAAAGCRYLLKASYTFRIGAQKDSYPRSSASLPDNTVPRYSSEARAGCVASASPDPCGGAGQPVSVPRPPTQFAGQRLSWTCVVVVV
jgi:hypothetical protein